MQNREELRGKAYDRSSKTAWCERWKNIIFGKGGKTLFLDQKIDPCLYLGFILLSSIFFLYFSSFFICFKFFIILSLFLVLSLRTFADFPPSRVGSVFSISTSSTQKFPEIYQKGGYL
jgi:hypothetical protein